MDSPASFGVTLSFQGKTVPLEGLTSSTTGVDLHERALEALGLSTETSLKILFKGKQLVSSTDCVVAASGLDKPQKAKKTPKLLVMATSKVVLADLATKRSDPTIRGFSQEPLSQSNAKALTPSSVWGEQLGKQDKNFKFCRFQACTWQSFGHRPTDGTTPHAFAAMQLLEKMATDPGVVAVLRERELVVGTLGEMDPIDDRLMLKKANEEGQCVLGYNTNAGARIDIKLRTDDLKAFRPYPQLVQTLIHELSHNWVGEHNLLFWTNYAQMRAEYLTRHAYLQSTIIDGKTTAEIAGLDPISLGKGVPSAGSRGDHIASLILKELVSEMAQHGLHPQAIEAPIRQRCTELEQEFLQGQKLGGESSSGSSSSASNSGPVTARERALAAAEERLRLSKQPRKDGPPGSGSA